MTGYTNSIEIDGAFYSVINSYIAVSYPSGLTCKCTAQYPNTSNYYTLYTNNTSGYALFPIPYASDWTVACYNESTLIASKVVTVVSNNTYEVRLSSRISNGDYQEVEWIQNTGYNFIDTGIRMIPRIEMTVDLEVASVSTTYNLELMCSQPGNGDNRSFFMLTNANPPKIAIQHGTTKRTSSVTVSPHVRHIITMGIDVDANYTGQAVATLDGTVLSGLGSCQNQELNSDTANAALFAVMNVNGAGSTTPRKSSPYGRIYSMVIKKGNLGIYNYSTEYETVANFIPCYNKTTNEAGLWDTVTKTFHGNAYTGSDAQNFIVGPDVI